MAEKTTQLLDFLKTIEPFKRIEREVYYSDGRKETDAEHSWHVAMFCWLFHKDFPGTDLCRMLKMALMHDLVEIYAGDTFAFDKCGQEGKKEREKVAADKLFAQLPDELKTEFTQLFEEYESESTQEAKIVKSFDKLQPTVQNLCSDGRGWKEHNITFKQVDEYKRKHMTHNKTILELYEKIMNEAKERKLLE